MIEEMLVLLSSLSEIELGVMSIDWSLATPLQCCERAALEIDLGKPALKLSRANMDTYDVRPL